MEKVEWVEGGCADGEVMSEVVYIGGEVMNRQRDETVIVCGWRGEVVKLCVLERVRMHAGHMTENSIATKGLYKAVISKHDAL